jgi:hypothetical protein
MAFDASPTNITELLVVVLAAVAVAFLLMKRYTSNLPLLFYFVAVMFTNMTERPVNPYLMYSGLAFALLLRFEFMNQGFAKVCAFFATSTMLLIIVVFLVQVFGQGSTLF